MSLREGSNSQALRVGTKTERKFIGGRLHKKVPCHLCKEMIWVFYRCKRIIATCTDCAGNINNTLHTTRGESDHTHEEQYDGDAGKDHWSLPRR